MKQVTLIKILKRYEKGLALMEQEAKGQGKIADAEHYLMDSKAMKQAINIIERSNTKS